MSLFDSLDETATVCEKCGNRRSARVLDRQAQRTVCGFYENVMQPEWYSIYSDDS